MELEVWRKKHIRFDRIIMVTLIITSIIWLFTTSGAKFATYYNSSIYTIALEKKCEQIKQDEQRKEEERIRIEQERERERELERLKKYAPLTQEQIEKVNNIYSQEEKVAFLTFDDGPSPAVTPLILDLLKKENIKATFFVLGDRVVANPELVKRAYEEGHYIANHGKTHIYSQIYTNSQTVLDEYNITNQAIRNAIGDQNYNARVFRFPGGYAGGIYSEIKKEARVVLNNNGVASLDWNALSKDSEGAKTKEQLIQNVITTVGQKNCVVILMHDANNKILTYETLPDVINYLRQNGYTFKCLYDIL